jgi:hypothetical protein
MLAIVGCSSGAIPVFTPRFYQGGAALKADAGVGDAIEFGCRYFRGSKSSFNPSGLPIAFCRTPVTTAGVIQAQSHDGVTGSSAIVASGTPNQRVDQFVLKILNDGTVGADGITFQYSFGGRDFSATQRLGTSLTWAVPDLGVTLTFDTGMTVKAGDIFTMRTSGPRASNADISTALADLLALPQKFRCVLIIGDYNETDMLALQADMDLWYLAGKRSIFFVSARDAAQLAQGTKLSTETITFAAAGHTITRNTGSWIVDGFTTLDDVIVSGSTSNNGNLGKPSMVSATVLTFSAGVVNETATSSSTLVISGFESESEWATALLANAASFQDTLGRVAWGAGQAWMPSDLRPGFRMREPGMWAVLERYMQHDLQISPNFHALGPIEGWEIVDDNGVVTEHDSRTLQVLEARGFLTLCSFIGEEGVFCGFPATFGPDGSAFDVIPWRAVANVMCDVVQIVTTTFIGDDPDLNPDGTLASEEVERYSNLVNQQLASELLSEKTEGRRASAASWAPHTDDVLNVPDAVMNGEGNLETNGLINQVNTTIFVNRNGA